MTDIVLRVELMDTVPRVWRCIRGPAQINLRRLHDVIQLVMGWENCHLYEFECEGRYYGEPNPIDDVVLPRQRISSCTRYCRD